MVSDESNVKNHFGGEKFQIIKEIKIFVGIFNILFFKECRGIVVKMQSKSVQFVNFKQQPKIRTDIYR